MTAAHKNHRNTNNNTNKVQRAPTTCGWGKYGRKQPKPGRLGVWLVQNYVKPVGRKTAGKNCRETKTTTPKQ